MRRGEQNTTKTEKAGTENPSTTVRISGRTHQRLKELAQQRGEPMQSVLDEAIEHYRRQRFLEECEAAYAALRQDSEAWAAYRDELTVWDATTRDGLDSEEWPGQATGADHG